MLENKGWLSEECPSCGGHLPSWKAFQHSVSARLRQGGDRSSNLNLLTVFVGSVHFDASSCLLAPCGASGRNNTPPTDSVLGSWAHANFSLFLPRPPPGGLPTRVFPRGFHYTACLVMSSAGLRRVMLIPPKCSGWSFSRSHESAFSGHLMLRICRRHLLVNVCWTTPP